eukprot:CAMPEP_0201517634 /NCGR_PEP_ID=MMETSP0161_2-20130828/8696_1 /ASSEMBLY_ACC=CAM_ASM_000251 /TAXON_ID=180227 /ORGANISM="Neoparamoeba aestuarina, Strain SoJaBio B1-5/56/2" /LENGTH=120 /DNA_ID=CAMNT_0047915187 /DNA_START=192 /DNA_END=551 /DNA_ORIENTATION=-
MTTYTVDFEVNFLDISWERSCVNLKCLSTEKNREKFHGGWECTDIETSDTRKTLIFDHSDDVVSACNTEPLADVLSRPAFCDSFHSAFRHVIYKQLKKRRLPFRRKFGGDFVIERENKRE